MSSPYVGEIRLVGFNFAPVGWAFCNGALMAIAENDTLFNLIGTTYGGDGQQTFGLPDLQSRIPIHQGTGAGSTYPLAETGGSETVTLNTNQIPSHSHPPGCNSGATQTTNSPSGAVWLNYNQNQYTDQPTATAMNAGAVSQAGGSQPHDNLQPYLAINFIISLFGIYPSQ
jgi:microcystin-dependent protein